MSAQLESERWNVTLRSLHAWATNEVSLLATSQYLSALYFDHISYCIYYKVEYKVLYNSGTLQNTSFSV